MAIFRDVRPEQVFTPRSPTVNKKMYVDRPEYERELKLAMRSGYHLIIYGDSGCGKSWLYKKVFEDELVVFATVDLNSCNEIDDIDLLLLEILEDPDEWIEERRTTEVEKGAMPYDIGRKSIGKRELRRQQKTPFEQLCKALRKKARNRKTFIVFENLEHAIMNQEVVTYLRSLILSLDDSSMTRSNVQICFVGVPSDIKMLLSDQNKYQTISNRITEISEVSRMSKTQVRDLVFQGFDRELSMSVENFDYCLSQIIYLTDRIPQYIHDLCLQIAFCAEEQGDSVSPFVVSLGAHAWVDTNGRQSREFIEKLIGPGRRRNDPKSRVFLALAKWEKATFYSTDIENLLRELFPISLANKRVHVTRMLNKLASGDMRFLKLDEETKNIESQRQSYVLYCGIAYIRMPKASVF